MQNTYKTVKHGCFILASLLILGFSSAPLLADDAISPTQVADQFDQAIKDGNTDLMRKILDDNVLIYEAGKVEASLEEYASHHMEADIAFMSQMEKTVLSRKAFEHDDMAVVSTQYKMRGDYKGRFIDKITMETLVLKKYDGAWKVIHIHWS